MSAPSIDVLAVLRQAEAEAAQQRHAAEQHAAYCRGVADGIARALDALQRAAEAAQEPEPDEEPA